MRTLARLAALWMILFAVICLAQEDDVERLKLDHPIRHVAGVVQRDNGEGIPNIDVEIFTGRNLVSATRTDNHGKFEADKLEPGDYDVWFTYKPHPVFHDVVYKVAIDPKGSKEALAVKLHPLH